MIMGASGHGRSHLQCNDGSNAFTLSMSLSIPVNVWHPGDVCVAAKTTYVPDLTSFQVAYRMMFVDGQSYICPGVYVDPVPSAFVFHDPENNHPVLVKSHDGHFHFDPVLTKMSG